MELTLKEVLAWIPKPSPRNQSTDTYAGGFNDAIAEAEFKIREYFKKKSVL